MSKLLAIVFASTMFAGPLAAQTPDTIVEVLGLRHWTVEMLEDSLHRYAPGTTLRSAACAVILRDSIGFAQAAAEIVDFGSAVFVTLSVVEPQDRERLKPLQLRDSTALRKEWRGIINVLENHPRAFGTLQHHRFFSNKTNMVGERPADSASIALRDSVRISAARTQLKNAVQAFTTDRNRDNRVAAALILGHFSDRPEAWRALIRGLRGPSDHATMAGVMILRSLARQNPPQVDWRRAEFDLMALMAGTNLFAYQEVLEVLTATRVSPELGRSLAVHGRDLLLSNLQSKNPQRRVPVIAFLRTIGGQTHDDPQQWVSWLRSL